MFRDYIVPIFQLVIFGPIVLFRLVFTIAAVTAVLTFLIPGLLVAFWEILGFVLSVAWDFVVHPSWLKIWVLVCLVAACAVVLPKFRLPRADLPSPKVRRGRHIDEHKSAQDRAIENIERRRDALHHSTHRRRRR